MGILGVNSNATDMWLGSLPYGPQLSLFQCERRIGPDDPISPLDLGSSLSSAKKDIILNIYDMSRA